MLFMNTFTGDRYYLQWDFVNRMYKVMNIDTGCIMYWTSFDLENALESGRIERIEK